MRELNEREITLIGAAALPSNSGNVIPDIAVNLFLVGRGIGLPIDNLLFGANKYKYSWVFACYGQALGHLLTLNLSDTLMCVGEATKTLFKSASDYPPSAN